MIKEPAILITGAAGFIGSSLVTELNLHGFNNLFLADNFTKPGKVRYLHGKSFSARIESADLFDFLNQDEQAIKFVFHLGGKTANKNDFFKQNVEFSQRLFLWSEKNQIPFVSASSSSTYGAGEFGYSDDEVLVDKLIPLNDYAKSKHEFDKWILKKKSTSPWTVLKIFNVFGPNEYHKGVSASVAFKSFFEIRETGKVILFGSSNPAYEPGEQQRDFIYIKDVVKILYWFLEGWVQHEPHFASGIYNVGSGVGKSFNDVAKSVFAAMGLPEKIEYKPIPANILKSYPDSVVAPVQKLRLAGYVDKMWTLENAINDLVKNYLSGGAIL
ncbi:MAG: NAD-dependent epimerase/dehydratase family protein [Chitinophagaceae bacterium]|nr:NAD-dependent epimerase/dehydratase family protein [Chitinophagaceae bacterium]